MGTTTRCTNCCSACRSHFTSLEAFDAHRACDHAEGRHCLYPDGVESLRVASENGVCSMLAEPRTGVTVYATVRNADARARLSLRETPRRLSEAKEGSAPRIGRKAPLSVRSGREHTTSERSHEERHHTDPDA
jgi:hypothetical protein